MLRTSIKQNSTVEQDSTIEIPSCFNCGKLISFNNEFCKTCLSYFKELTKRKIKLGDKYHQGTK